MKNAAAALIFLAAANAAPASADIVIGVVGPLSGQYQSFGQQMLGGVKAAVDAINAKGAFGNEQLSIASADDQCDSAKADEVVRKLIAAHADVVIGSFCSNPSLAEAKVLEKAGVMLISPSATLPTFTESGLSNVIRVSTRIDAQGAFAARRILARRPNAKLAVLDDSTAQMKAIVQSFTAAYGKPTSLSTSFTPGQKDFAELAAKLKAAEIDTLYLAASAPDAGRITAAAKAAGLDLKRYGPDSLLADPFWEASGPAGETTLVSFPSDPINTSKARNLSDYLKALGEATEGPALPAYAALELYAAAAGAAGPHAGLGLAQALKSGSATETSFGRFTFDSKGDGQDLRFSWFSWNNGTYQTIAAESQ
jgi:branched-chain amino acid transport system substrate-binding protein